MKGHELSAQEKVAPCSIFLNILMYSPIAHVNHLSDSLDINVIIISYNMKSPELSESSMLGCETLLRQVTPVDCGVHLCTCSLSFDLVFDVE